MPVIDGVSFPKNRLERALDWLRYKLTAPRIPARPEPEDWDPPLAEVVLLTLDD